MCNFIPLGSIVLLRGGVQKILVISRGLKVKNDETEKEFFFDYGGVPYPEGLISDQILYFNHENISKVVFEGYSDIDSENVEDNINRYLEENPGIVKGDPNNWSL